VKFTISALILVMLGWFFAPLGQRFINWLIPPALNYKLAARLARLAGLLARSAAERDEVRDLLGLILASDPARLAAGEKPEVTNPLAVVLPVFGRCLYARLGGLSALLRIPLRAFGELLAAVTVTVVPVAQAAIAGAALSALALLGQATVALAGATALLVFALTLIALYVRGRRPSRPPIPPNRRERDRGIFVGTIVAAAPPAALAAAALTLDLHPLGHTPRLVAAAIIATSLAAPVVFASTLCDWYLILPRLSGLVGRAPCQEARRARWRALTQFWYCALRPGTR
jgi:hypothetical protein